MDVGAEEIWSAKNEPEFELPESCILEWNEKRGVWQLSMLEGPFSGYPTIDLNREDLERLRDKLIEELSRERRLD